MEEINPMDELFKILFGPPDHERIAKEQTYLAQGYFIKWLESERERGLTHGVGDNTFNELVAEATYRKDQGIVSEKLFSDEFIPTMATCLLNDARREKEKEALEQVPA